MSRYPDGIDPGLDLGTRDLVITQELIAKYLGSIEADNPWYSEDSPFNGPIAPAAVLHYEIDSFKGWHPPGISKILNNGRWWEFNRPTRPGQRITMKARVASRYVKRGREHIGIEVTVSDQQGGLICRCGTTDSWPVRET